MRVLILLLCLLEVQAFNPWNGLDACTEHAAGPVCVCCAMLQRVGRLKELLADKLSKLEDEYNRTQQNLEKFLTHRTAFTYVLYINPKPAVASVLCVGPFPSYKILQYKHALLDMWGDYNVESGVFVVRFSGVYSLAVTVFSDTGVRGAYDTCAHLRVNQALMAGAADQQGIDREDMASFTLLLHLQAGDQVDVVLAKGCMLCDNSNLNSFTAFLLTADY